MLLASKADVVLTDKTIKTVPLDAKVVLVTPNFSDKKRITALDFPGDARGAQAEHDDATDRYFEKQ
ncbi:MAG: hypothetical protein WKF71_01230 [Pyrinomonadaceae bacterium]